MAADPTREADLAAARAAYERHAWAEAYERLTAADHAAALDVRDLERLAITSWLAGHPDEMLATAARAHVEAARIGETELAIRAARALGTVLLQRGESAQGSGWLARAARVVEESGYDGPELGHLLIADGLRAFMSGEPGAALAIFEKVAAIAARFGDPDLAAFGRLGRGQSLIALGEVDRGVTLLDEAMTSVIAGEVTPIPAGTVYCAVIGACQDLFDVRRAQEWTAALSKWLETEPEMLPFRGNCLVFRAAVMRFHGAWADALSEAERARELMLRPPPVPEVGEAFYELAEIDRLRGHDRAAEEGYRQASSWGRLPEPGHALLRLAQGDIAAATAAIRRAQVEADGDAIRARYLEPSVEIALAAGDTAAAREAADRLASMATALGAPLLQAMAFRADGAVRLAEGDVDRSLGVLRRAWEAWMALEAPYEAARVRALTAVACRALGDHDGEAREIAAAREVFERLGAGPDLARLTTIERSGRAVAAAALPGGLSAREAEVLRLLAAGHTNKAIAETLTISERTVDRHVSNIYTKLDVSTRAAATAFAYEHGLL
jgi:DNA-binding CsgD family transcriptional regulator/HPt (histidine-containing phosphotransfer) domain-containing protein